MDLQQAIIRECQENFVSDGKLYIQNLSVQVTKLCFNNIWHWEGWGLSYKVIVLGGGNYRLHEMCTSEYLWHIAASIKLLLPAFPTDINHMSVYNILPLILKTLFELQYWHQYKKLT